MTGLVFRSLTAANEADLVALFDRPGLQRRCWCMVWRATAAEGRGTPAEVRREQLLGRIAAGVPVGVLGYHEAVPVAWVSIAPKPSYRRLGGPRPRPGEAVWAIACFYVRRDFRGQGFVALLLAAAVDHAREEGATVVEGYPVAADSPTFGYMGRLATFERAGFTEVGRIGQRHVMRRWL